MTVFCGCKSAPSYLKREYKIVDMAATSQRADLPSKLFDMLAEKNGLNAGPAIKDLTRGKDLFPFDLYLFTEVESEQNAQLRFRFPKGGGHLDLAEYPALLESSALRLGMVPRVEGDYDGLSTIFYSRSKKFKGGPSTFGLGCNILLDITKLFAKAVQSDGWRMSTIDHQHLENLQGTFVFSLKNEDKLKIAQVTIVDSSRPETLCGPAVIKKRPDEEVVAEPSPTPVAPEAESHP
jgi:hypothetical protein